MIAQLRRRLGESLSAFVVSGLGVDRCHFGLLVGDGFWRMTGGGVNGFLKVNGPRLLASCSRFAVQSERAGLLVSKP